LLPTELLLICLGQRQATSIKLGDNRNLIRNEDDESDIKRAAPRNKALAIILFIRNFSFSTAVFLINKMSHALDET
jgi:hypothetical protein